MLARLGPFAPGAALAVFNVALQVSDYKNPSVATWLWFLTAGLLLLAAYHSTNRWCKARGLRLDTAILLMIFLTVAGIGATGAGVTLGVRLLRHGNDPLADSRSQQTQGVNQQKWPIDSIIRDLQIVNGGHERFLFAVGKFAKSGSVLKIFVDYQYGTSIAAAPNPAQGRSRVKIGEIHDFTVGETFNQTIATMTAPPDGIGLTWGQEPGTPSSKFTVGFFVRARLTFIDAAETEYYVPFILFPKQRHIEMIGTQSMKNASSNMVIIENNVIDYSNF